MGFQVGVRESAQSWRELLVDLKARGLATAPELATGDGALGFWKALEAIFPTTRHQRCWVHKVSNALNQLPQSVQPAAKADLREVWQAPDRTTAEAAIATFAEKYAAKYEKAVACLVKDCDALLTFYDFPAEHWDHLRTSDEMDKRFRRSSCYFLFRAGDLVAKSGASAESSAGPPYPSPAGVRRPRTMPFGGLGFRRSTKCS